MCFLLPDMSDRVVDFGIDWVPDTVLYGTDRVKGVEGVASGTP